MTSGFSLTPKQVEANRLLGGPQTHTLLRGGSRSGKTFLIVRATIIRAAKAPGTRHAIFRSRFNHVKASIWKDTLPKVRRLCFPTLPMETNETDLEAKLPNGSSILLGGLDEKDRVEKILGQEFATLGFNEVSQIPYTSVEMALSRLAQKSELQLRALYDCNPPGKSHWTYQLFRLGLRPGTREPVADRGDYAEMLMNPRDNAANLDPGYFKLLAGMSAARRLRFEAGEWASEVPGALWRIDELDRARIGLDGYPELARVVVAVDPPASSGDGAAECGIMVCGRGVDGKGYLLADRTIQGATPEGWAREVVRAYRDFEADRVVAEVNNGGDMVGTVIRQAMPNISYRAVRATRGKVSRAEPISALYEQGRIHHCGQFPELEDQMSEFTTDFDVDERGYSPDRVDALVWGFTDLMLGGSGMRSGQARI